jgi:thiol-disulfide isomerase/thioredoxin
MSEPHHQAPRETVSPEGYLERRAASRGRERWAGLVLVLALLAAAGLTGRRLWAVAAGPRPPSAGTLAPAFSAPQLEGGELALSDFSGEVVVLDFWATWCPPCRKAMPKIEALSEQYADQSVVVYAVNQQESAEKVKQFMEQQDLDLTVLLDKSGSIGSNYGVRGIPTTVLIGKDGTVQATHSGYSPTIQDMLSSQIDKLLAGQSLVESGE